jgi:hypothetical protein
MKMGDKNRIVEIYEITEKILSKNHTRENKFEESDLAYIDVNNFRGCSDADKFSMVINTIKISKNAHLSLTRTQISFFKLKFSNEFPCNHKDPFAFDPTSESYITTYNISKYHDIDKDHHYHHYYYHRYYYKF